ncbi:hypothetical protein niasHT_019304 [Heterodera trifolii]|uniref:BPTI/Kunitz inhibitor domain-containing protein n=1 Tax=Heterodera trifolii TaxID=157864 RepID=A0ABD2L5L3_9BILA
MQLSVLSFAFVALFLTSALIEFTEANASNANVNNGTDTNAGKEQNVCLLKKDEGTGNGRVIRWWHDKVDDKCKVFIYKGSGGNGNRFNTKAACEKKCKK